ncbi:MAG: hypothetical protein M2R45_04945 [Verrucomicrobia subdivision 3 bacterium]|nr:hypothetical protein [Limisphaerales bacterium]MCS1415618.1 hypothetical protein [Limisphaerales bacterium]
MHLLRHCLTIVTILLIVTDTLAVTVKAKDGPRLRKPIPTPTPGSGARRPALPTP